MTPEISTTETVDRYDRLLLLINAVAEDNAKVNRTLTELAKEMNRVVVINNKLISQNTDDGKVIRDTLLRYLGLVVFLLIIIVGGVLLKEVFLSYNKPL